MGQPRVYVNRPVAVPSPELAAEYDSESPGESWRKYTRLVDGPSVLERPALGLAAPVCSSHECCEL